MRQFLLLISIFLTMCLSMQSDACGGITHMLIAKESINFMPDATLRNVILNNMDAYLVGSNYPDSGYVDGAHYGEDSHWEPFITAFIDYLRQRYTYPDQQNPQLVAFLLGCATHSEADIIFHGVFLDKVAAEDFQGDKKAAHKPSEDGLDLLINVERNQWFVRPRVWWVPVKDLLAVYHLMGKDQYTEAEILWGNAVYSKAGIGERIISPEGYEYTKWKMPWLSANYYNSPDGGIVVNEQAVAVYTENVWHRLIDSSHSR